jgi:phage shock protein C
MAKEPALAFFRFHGTSSDPCVYCPQNNPNPDRDNMARLTRSSTDKMLLGVCGGLARRFGVDSTLVRVVFAIASFVGVGSPILLYFILAVIIPRD